MQKNIAWENDSLPIFQPRFLDAAKTRLKGIVQFPDGRFIEMEGNRADSKSTFVRDIFAQYSVEEIDAFTAREAALREAREKVESQSSEDAQQAEEREITFQAKAKALELPEVAQCKDKRVARRIRKSKSAFEVAGWLAVAFMLSLEEERASAEAEAQALA